MSRPSSPIKPGRMKSVLFLIFAVAVAVNVAGGKFVEAFYVPLYMTLRPILFAMKEWGEMLSADGR